MRRHRECHGPQDTNCARIAAAPGDAKLVHTSYGVDDERGWHPTTDEHLALVLSGGGARAAYQVGVLSAVAERFPDLRIDALLPMREVPT